MPFIMSLVGLTASGKSTAAVALKSHWERVAPREYPVVIIKRDEIMRRLARERFGERFEWIAYTPLSCLRFRARDVYDAINAEIQRHYRSPGRPPTALIILEGGTRTHAACRRTLYGTRFADVRLVYFEISPGPLWQRIKSRRAQINRRFDDLAPIMAGKLLMQFWASHRPGAVRPGDLGVVSVDASESPDAVAQALVQLSFAHIYRG